mgnify:FL=1
MSQCFLQNLLLYNSLVFLTYNVYAFFYRFTDEDSAQLNQWRMMSLENTTSYALALKRGQIYYFYIFAITESGELTDRSNYYEYDPEGI